MRTHGRIRDAIEVQAPSVMSGIRIEKMTPTSVGDLRSLREVGRIVLPRLRRQHAGPRRMSICCSRASRHCNSGTRRSRFPGQPAIRAGIGEHTGWCGDRTSGDPSLGAGSTVPIVTAEPFVGWARSPRCSTRRPRFARAFVCPRPLQKVLALIPRRRSTVRPGRGRGGGRCSTPDRAFGRRIWHGAWS